MADNKDGESRIIELLFARDERAIVLFRTLYGRMCQTIAHSVTGDSRDAEECVNDTCLRLWNSIPPEHPLSLKAYAGRITRNLALNLAERNGAKKRAAVLVELDECVAADIDEADAGELTEMIDSFLETCTPTDAKLFVRRYWYNEPVADIARRFGFTANKVTKRLTRIRAGLRLYLNERGVTL